MSRNLTKTVPSEYIPLDQRVSDADSFVNVRDLQVARQNHNILMAKRIKRTISTCTFDENAEKFYGIDMDGTNPRLIWRQLIAVNQWTKSLHLYMRANCTDVNVASALTDSVLVYPVLSPRAAPRKYYTSIAIDVTTPSSATEGSAGDYTADVPLPAWSFPPQWEGRQLVDFSMYMFGKVDTGRTVSASVTITDYGRDWISLSGATAVVGNCIQVGSQYRVVAGVSGTRYFLDRGFSDPIDVSTATADIRETMGIRIWSMSLYENVDSDLSTPQVI